MTIALLVAVIVGLNQGEEVDESQVRHIPVYMKPSESPYCNWTQLYLPKGVSPSHYQITLQTDLKPPYLVTGISKIDLAVEDVTPCIVLHSLGLNITNVKLLVGDGGEEGADVISGQWGLQGYPTTSVTDLEHMLCFSSGHNDSTPSATYMPFQGPFK